MRISKEKERWAVDQKGMIERAAEGENNNHNGINYNNNLLYLVELYS